MTSNKYLWGLEILVVYSLLTCAWAVQYLGSPSYMDYAHADPGAVVATQQWMHGRPLYGPPDGGATYSLIYGPMNFLPTAVGLWLFHDPITGGKFPGVFLCLLALGLFIWAARRTLPWPEALIASGLLSIQSLILHTFIFGMPVNPVLELAAVLGILSLTFPGWGIRVGLLAFATALAFGSKVHGPVYLLPAWTMLWIDGGWKRFVGCAVMAMVLFLAVFCIPGISLWGYLDWVREASHHSLQSKMFTRTVGWEFVLGLPVLIYFVIPRKWKFWTADRELKTIGISILVGMVIVLAPASKEGAGYHHAWPFIPWIAWFTVRWLHSLRAIPVSPRVVRLARICLFAWIGLLAFHVWESANAIGGYFRQCPRLAYVEQDIKDILRRYDGVPVQMGYGSDRGYSLTYFRPYVYARDTPCFVDAPSAMDFVAAGGSLEPDLKAMLARKQDVWLIPKGDVPFSMKTWYMPRTLLFGESFEKAFRENYTKVDSSLFFDIYEANAVVGQNGP